MILAQMRTESGHEDRELTLPARLTHFTELGNRKGPVTSVLRGPSAMHVVSLSETLTNDRRRHKADKHSPTRDTGQTGRSVELRAGLVGPLVVIAELVRTTIGRERRVSHGAGRSLAMM